MAVFSFGKYSPFGRRSVDFDSANYIEKINKIESTNILGRWLWFFLLKNNSSSVKNKILKSHPRPSYDI